MAVQKVIIIGAAGRDFHNFNTLYRGNPDYDVVAFTATQIPEIDGRVYPAVLAGDWQAFAHYDLPGGLGRISAPVWVATGGDDRLAPLPCAHFLAAGLPAARRLPPPPRQLRSSPGPLSPPRGRRAVPRRGMRTAGRELIPAASHLSRAAHRLPSPLPAAVLIRCRHGLRSRPRLVYWR